MSNELQEFYHFSDVKDIIRSMRESLKSASFQPNVSNHYLTLNKRLHEFRRYQDLKGGLYQIIDQLIEIERNRQMNRSSEDATIASGIPSHY